MSGSALIGIDLSKHGFRKRPNYTALKLSSASATTKCPASTTVALGSWLTEVAASEPRVKNSCSLKFYGAKMGQIARQPMPFNAK